MGFRVLGLGLGFRQRCVCVGEPARPGLRRAAGRHRYMPHAGHFGACCTVLLYVSYMGLAECSVAWLGHGRGCTTGVLVGCRSWPWPKAKGTRRC